MLDRTALRIAAIAVAFSAAVSAAQESAPAGSVWDGVYTAAQADAGRTVFSNRCAGCHGEDPATSRNPLAGDRFAEHWESRTVADLFRRIRDTMPPGESIIVSDPDKLTALAYILQANGFPEGSRALGADTDALAAIRITRRNGPGPLRTGTLVRAGGCLEQASERGWRLTRANEPERATLDSPAAVGKAPAAAAQPGAGTIELLNVYPNPAPYAGRRIAVTGLLVRSAAGDAINVVSLEVIAPACAP
jgi:S-disulfanyl-L-cysteine oxidoreductase SoxD